MSPRAADERADHRTDEKMVQQTITVRPTVRPRRTASSGEATPDAVPSLVSLTSVWRSWGRGVNRRSILRGVDLDLSPGTGIYISGRNGAGKTTLLRICTGILAPDAGTVEVNAISLSSSWRRYHRRIGFVAAGDRGLYARLTVRDHLAHWLGLALVPRRERAAAIEGALIVFDLLPLAARRAERLSQGQRQRLRLALAFVHQPNVLFLDEPSSSLDEDGRAVLDAAVADVLARGGAAICCGPMGERQLPCLDRSAVLQDGQLRCS